MFFCFVPIIVVHILYSLLLGVILIQSFYFLFFYARFFLYGKKNDIATTVTSHPENVSVVIPLNTYHENNLIAFIQLLKQNPNIDCNFEIIFVLHASSNIHESGFEKLYQLHNQVKVIQLHQESQQIIGDKYAIAIGIKSATYDNILLTRENCLPDSNEWISAMLNNVEKGTDMVLGYFSYQQEHSFFNKFIRYENTHHFMQVFSYALAHTPMMGSGMNMFLSRTAFYDNKGFASFNSFVGGEDNLLVNQLSKNNNVKVSLSKQSFVTYKSFVGQSQWNYYKNIYFSTIKYFKIRHQLLLSIYVFSYLLFYTIGIACLALQGVDLLLLCMIICRLGLSYSIMGFSLKRMNQPDLIKWMPIMEIAMLWYYISYGFQYFKSAKKVH